MSGLRSTSTGPTLLPTWSASTPRRRRLIALMVWTSVVLLSADLVYKTYYGITYYVREKCILYASLPRWTFLIIEYVLELFLVVVVGVFVAALVERYFRRIRKYVPRSPFMAFVVASIIPVCSCSAIPLISAMRDRVPLRTIVSFVVAAPLLNPYIIVLSVSVLGVEYALVRIAAAMVLALTTGYVTEFFWRKMGQPKAGMPPLCQAGSGCTGKRTHVLDATFATLKKIMPFLLVAGLMGMAVEWLGPDRLLFGFDLSDNLASTALVILVGVPVYFCNGADVLFLKPLLQNAYLPLGAAIAFSLTSTSVCVTSLVLLVKYLGRSLTLVILSSVVITALLLSCLVELLTSLG